MAPPTTRAVATEKVVVDASVFRRRVHPNIFPRNVILPLSTHRFVAAWPQATTPHAGTQRRPLACQGTLPTIARITCGRKPAAWGELPSSCPTAVPDGGAR